MTIRNYFLALIAAVLAGCGSSSSPSNHDVERAITEYVGLARPDIGEVKVDDLKLLNDSQKKASDDDVFVRGFEVHYTVTYKGNPSKHFFSGTVALVKQGQNWVLKRELCTLTQVDSPPIVDAATQAMKNPTSGEDQRNREQAAKGQTNHQP
jgi:hypothetical protein